MDSEHDVMSEVEAEDDLVGQVTTYIVDKHYPLHCSKNLNRIIRRKSKRFEFTENRELLYKKKNGRKVGEGQL